MGQGYPIQPEYSPSRCADNHAIILEGCDIIRAISKQLVFIDDSGDLGFKAVSSDNFVMAAAIFINSEVAESIMHEINDYRASLGWKYNHEFKFTKNPKNIVIEILRRISEYVFRVYAVYIEKSDFREITPAMAPFFDREKLYNWTIKELLQEIPL